MTTKIPVSSIQLSTVIAITGPRIANIQVANSTYVATGSNTVSTLGGHVIINGGGFDSNVNVVINNVPATSVTRVSSTQLNSQIPALPSGNYTVYVTNIDNGKVAIRPNGITVG